MGNVAFTNKALDLTTANNAFSALWKLSRAIKKAGGTYLGSGNGTTKDTSSVAANDLWGGNVDPAADVYPTALDAVAAWIAFRLPSTLKFAITAAPTGGSGLQRGEPVTQATTGATGELLGYVFSTTTGTGWAIVMPRTGAFDGTHVITGAASGTSLTPTTLTTYVREIVFWKSAGSVTDGSIYYICADSTGESAQLFSQLMLNASCTATVAPAGSNTAGQNNFPAKAFVVRGTAAVSGGSAASHTAFFVNTSQFGNFQALAFNATPSAGISADGSFWVTISNTATTGTSTGIAFHRCDDGEPGDVDPYVWQAQSGSTSASSGGTPSRTSSTGFFNAPQWSSGNLGSNIAAVFRGYCGRGVTGNQAAHDAMTTFYLKSGAVPSVNTPSLVQNQSDVMREANHPDATPPVVQEPARVFGDATGLKIEKGRLRHGAFFPIGAGFDSFDSKNWMVLVSQNAATFPAFALRYDGATTPSP